jgi:hypothetical protein
MVSKVGLQVGVTPDRQKVSIGLIVDDRIVGWAELNAEQCDQFTNNVAAYRAMLLPEIGISPEQDLTEPGSTGHTQAH